MYMLCIRANKATFDFDFDFMTLGYLERSKLRCRKCSNIDIRIVRYCVRVNPRFSIDLVCSSEFLIRLQKINNVMPTASRAPMSMNLLFRGIINVRYMSRIEASTLGLIWGLLYIMCLTPNSFQHPKEGMLQVSPKVFTPQNFIKSEMVWGFPVL